MAAKKKRDIEWERDVEVARNIRNGVLQEDANDDQSGSTMCIRASSDLL